MASHSCNYFLQKFISSSRCKPYDEIVAIKCASLELMEADLSELILEAQLMRKYRHPNILSLHCAFVVGEYCLY